VGGGGSDAAGAGGKVGGGDWESGSGIVNVEKDPSGELSLSEKRLISETRWRP